MIVAPKNTSRTRVFCNPPIETFKPKQSPCSTVERLKGFCWREPQLPKVTPKSNGHFKPGRWQTLKIQANTFEQLKLEVTHRLSNLTKATPRTTTFAPQIRSGNFSFRVASNDFNAIKLQAILWLGIGISPFERALLEKEYYGKITDPTRRQILVKG